MDDSAKIETITNIENNALNLENKINVTTSIKI